ncbi:MAG: hypothetical protein AAF206_11120 [Bacteroidota bacterium]
MDAIAHFAEESPIILFSVILLFILSLGTLLFIIFKIRRNLTAKISHDADASKAYQVQQEDEVRQIRQELQELGNRMDSLEPFEEEIASIKQMMQRIISSDMIPSHKKAELTPSLQKLDEVFAEKKISREAKQIIRLIQKEIAEKASIKIKSRSADRIRGIDPLVNSVLDYFAEAFQAGSMIEGKKIQQIVEKSNLDDEQFLQFAHKFSTIVQDLPQYTKRKNFSQESHELVLDSLMIIVEAFEE